MGIFKRGRPSRKEPSNEPGLSVFRNKRTKRVDYIGETNNLKRRKITRPFAYRTRRQIMRYGFAITTRLRWPIMIANILWTEV